MFPKWSSVEGMNRYPKKGFWEDVRERAAGRLGGGLGWVDEEAEAEVDAGMFEVEVRYLL